MDILIDNTKSVQAEQSLTKVVIELDTAYGDMSLILQKASEMLLRAMRNNVDISESREPGAIIRVRRKPKHVGQCAHLGCENYFFKKSPGDQYCVMHNTNVFAAKRFLALKFPKK